MHTITSCGLCVAAMIVGTTLLLVHQLDAIVAA